MATLDDAARMAAALPEVTEGESRGNRTWSVGGKAFAWTYDTWTHTLGAGLTNL